jgi:cysteinyl-tRNA synthetase
MTAIQIYNSLTRRKEPLTPIEPGHVRMYVCGMTVYDYCHIGHARMWVVFDMVVRYLRSRGYRVTYVRNITDIDDKIIKRAAENGEQIDALTARFIDAMHEDMDALGLLRPDDEPRATQHIPQIVDMIGKLVEHGNAYVAANGDVYFRVRSFDEYGALSGAPPDELRSGARIEPGEMKEDPLDFALWKAAKPGEPSWDSPWGPGRPGWHIECSAMSTQRLGNHFDIHGGGQDLRFPHHENEIAQSRCATGEPFVNLWMHNGFVRVNEEKMSKSLGNFFTIREVLASYPPEVVRFFLTSSHYRSPVNYSDDSLETAKSALTAYYIALKGLRPAAGADAGEYGERFHAAMDDDFNTPEALAVLADLRRSLNRARESGDENEASRLAGVLRSLAEPLGVMQADPETFLRGGGTQDGLSDADIDRLIAERTDARAGRDWARADRIRDQLAGAGVVLEDGAGGTTWRRE